MPTVTRASCAATAKPGGGSFSLCFFLCCTSQLPDMYDPSFNRDFTLYDTSFNRDFTLYGRSFNRDCTETKGDRV